MNPGFRQRPKLSQDEAPHPPTVGRRASLLRFFVGEWRRPPRVPYSRPPTPHEQRENHSIETVVYQCRRSGWLEPRGKLRLREYITTPAGLAELARMEAALERGMDPRRPRTKRGPT